MKIIYKMLLVGIALSLQGCGSPPDYTNGTGRLPDGTISGSFAHCLVFDHSYGTSVIDYKNACNDAFDIAQCNMQTQSMRQCYIIHVQPNQEMVFLARNTFQADTCPAGDARKEEVGSYTSEYSYCAGADNASSRIAEGSDTWTKNLAKVAIPAMSAAVDAGNVAAQMHYDNQAQKNDAKAMAQLSAGNPVLDEMSGTSTQAAMDARQKSFQTQQLADNMHTYIDTRQELNKEQEDSWSVADDFERKLTYQLQNHREGDAAPPVWACMVVKDDYIDQEADAAAGTTESKAYGSSRKWENGCSFDVFFYYSNCTNGQCENVKMPPEMVTEDIYYHNGVPCARGSHSDDNETCLWNETVGSP